MARLSKRVWENSSLTRRTKILVYQACVLSTLLYGSEAWTTYMRQEHRLNAFHMRCLRRILGINWQDHITNREVLSRAGVSSMYSLLSQRRLRWLGHLHRMDDGRLPKDILYGQLARGKRRPGGPRLRFTVRTEVTPRTSPEPEEDKDRSLRWCHTGAKSLCRVSLVVCWATLGKHGNFMLKQSSPIPWQS